MDKFFDDTCKNCGNGIVRFKDDPVSDRWTHLHADVDDYNETLRVIASENCPTMKAAPSILDKDYNGG